MPQFCNNKKYKGGPDYMKLPIVLLISLYLTGMITPAFYMNDETFIVGVVDRLEGDLAVILLEEAGEELVLPAEKLGEFAEKDTWLLIRIESGELEILGSLDSLEKARLKLVNNIMEKLSAK